MEWKWNWVGTAVTRSAASLGRISSTSTMRLVWLCMAASTWEEKEEVTNDVRQDTRRWHAMVPNR